MWRYLSACLQLGDWPWDDLFDNLHAGQYFLWVYCKVFSYLTSFYFFDLAKTILSLGTHILLMLISYFNADIFTLCSKNSNYKEMVARAMQEDGLESSPPLVTIFIFIFKNLYILLFNSKWPWIQLSAGEHLFCLYFNFKIWISYFFIQNGLDSSSLLVVISVWFFNWMIFYFYTYFRTIWATI